jgi:hypothetical protein
MENFKRLFQTLALIIHQNFEFKDKANKYFVALLKRDLQQYISFS